MPFSKLFVYFTRLENGQILLFFPLGVLVGNKDSVKSPNLFSIWSKKMRNNFREETFRILNGAFRH